MAITKSLGMRVKELDVVLSTINPDKTEALIDNILSADKIFFAGAGCSGFMIRAAAMRLMHLGLKTLVVGETVTPAIGK